MGSISIQPVSPSPLLFGKPSVEKSFQMPGTSVPGFLRKSIQIADAGIYDVRIHRDEVVAPLVRHWQALELPMTTEVGQRAQEVLARHLDELEQMARRYEERRELRRMAALSAGSPKVT